MLTVDWIGHVGPTEVRSVRCVKGSRQLCDLLSIPPSHGPHIHGIPSYHHTRIPTHEGLYIHFIIQHSTFGFRFFLESSSLTSHTPLWIFLALSYCILHSPFQPFIAAQAVTRSQAGSGLIHDFHATFVCLSCSRPLHVSRSPHCCTVPLFALCRLRFALFL